MSVRNFLNVLGGIGSSSGGGGGTPGGSSGDIQYNNAGSFGGITPGTGVATALTVNTGSAGAMVLYNGAGGTPSAINLSNGTNLPSTALPSMSSATFLGLITDETGGTGVVVGNQGPTINSPIVSGTWTAAGSRIATASAMGALAIDGNSAVNTKSISADQTLTVANSPATDSYFGLWLTNTDTASHTMTHTGGTPATFTAPVGTTFYQWRVTGAGAYTMLGGPPSFNDFSTVTAASGDFIPFWDISAGTTGKSTLTNFLGAAPNTSIPAAAVASGALTNGMTATTQAAGSADTKVATDAYADTAALATNLGTFASPNTAAGSITWTSPLYQIYTSAASTRTYTLPAASSYGGRAVMLYVAVGTGHVNFQPASGAQLVLNGTLLTANHYIQAASSAPGNYMTMISDGTNWISLGSTGTWADAASA